MTFFEEEDYLEIIRMQMREFGRKRGYQTQLAREAGCQVSYFSQVLSGRAQLSMEQAAGLAAFWKFDELKTDYFIALVALHRAGTQALKDKITRDIQRLRSQVPG